MDGEREGMIFDITIWGALVAGLLSFLSPCVLPLVPAYLGFLGGTTIDQLTDDSGVESRGDRLVKYALITIISLMILSWLLPFVYGLFVQQGHSSQVAGIGEIMRWLALALTILIILLALVSLKGAKRRVLLASFFFVLGLTAVFVSLGAAASFIGSFIAVYKNELGMAAGALIIVFGLHFLGILRIPLLYRSARMDVQLESASFAGAFLMGMAFAFGWTPCVGPVLAPILTLAGSSESVTQGVGLLFIYSMGLGIPFVMAAIMVTPFMGFMSKFRKHLTTVEKVMGLLMIITGILFITGSLGYFGINSIGVWILDMFPSLATLG